MIFPSSSVQRNPTQPNPTQSNLLTPLLTTKGAGESRSRTHLPIVQLATRTGGLWLALFVHSSLSIQDYSKSTDGFSCHLDVEAAACHRHTRTGQTFRLGQIKLSPDRLMDVRTQSTSKAPINNLCSTRTNHHGTRTISLTRASPEHTRPSYF
jgi:hypothetical protein